MLQVKNLSHGFGDKPVLDNINLEIPTGQVVALVGPSGCGKSTLLKAILGTHPARDGEVLAGGVPVRRPTRDIGIVYQDYSLFEFLTAVQNVSFGLTLDKTSIPFRLFNFWRWWKLKKEFHQKSLDMLSKVKLSGVEDLYPSQMSGGMRQRTAIAQALVMQPKILLLDEPFGALDEATREELQNMLIDLCQENIEAKKNNQTPPYTIVMVTHELYEAIYVSDRVIGLAPNGNGANVIYDKFTPVYSADEPKDSSMPAVVKQKEEIRRIVFGE